LELSEGVPGYRQFQSNTAPALKPDFLQKQAYTREGNGHLADNPLRAVADRTPNQVPNAIKDAADGPSVMRLLTWKI
jgi:hypothetical protein